MGGEKKSFWRTHSVKLTGGLLGMLIMGLCLSVLVRHYLRASEEDVIAMMEARLLDARFNLRGLRKPTGKVGILAIDEKSIQKFGRFPFSRRHYAQAFRNLKALGVRWIGFDVVWDKPEMPLLTDAKPSLDRLQSLSQNPAAPTFSRDVAHEVAQLAKVTEPSIADQTIADAIRSFSQIVLGFFFYASESEAAQLGEQRFAGLESMESAAIQAVIMPDGKSLDDYPALKVRGMVANTPFISGNSEHFAFFNNESDRDAIVRWVTLVRSVEGRLMPSLSLKLAAAMQGREIVAFIDQAGVTEIALMNPEDDQDLIKIPVDHRGQGRILVNHLGPSMTIRHISLADAYDNRFSPKERAALKGMSLILGPTATAINDQRANPFDAGINGVETHAAVVDNIMARSFMRRADGIYVTELAIVLAIGLLFTPLLVLSRAGISATGVVLFLVGYYYLDRELWFKAGQWVYIGMPYIEISSLFISITLYKYFAEERDKKKVKGAFGLYLAPEVIDQVLQDPEALKPGGERKELTVFFSDVRSFTTISEALTPEKLCELMNDYFTPMADLILRSRGVLDKYIGDAIMAFWGAPIQIPNHAEVACQASIQMLFALDRLKVDLRNKGFPPIDIGIGLNTGLMSVGNMGSPQRFCYTVMGDAVNLGSRLEGATKDYGIKIMISQATQTQLSSRAFFTRDLDDIRVKGKMEPVKVFELMRPDLLPNEGAIRNLIGEFEAGRAAYREQKWDVAKKHFGACLVLRPEDGPASLYLERVTHHEKEPYMEQWDGVYTRKSK